MVRCHKPFSAAETWSEWRGRGREMNEGMRSNKQQVAQTAFVSFLSFLFPSAGDGRKNTGTLVKICHFLVIQPWASDPLGFIH